MSEFWIFVAVSVFTGAFQTFCTVLILKNDIRWLKGWVNAISRRVETLEQDKRIQNAR